jgi:hypothetical protein
MTGVAVIELVFLILALVAFIVAAIPATAAKVNFVAIGLAFWVLVVILQTLGVH